jgi:oxygen-independent coproporphyrinogen III oxidase
MLAARLAPDHFSLYALTLEHGTPLQTWTTRGLVPEPDPDLAAEMYEWAGEYLEKAGFIQYEISNWARRLSNGSMRSCEHNIQYWRNLPYFGFGAGAHGYAGELRVSNVLSPAAYIHRMSSKIIAEFPRTPANINAVRVSRQDEIGETMMMGLRLVQEGVSSREFHARFGERLEKHFADPIERLIQLELLEWYGDALRLTKKGRLLGNRVFVEFI